MSTTIPARFWTDAYGDQLKIRQGNPCGARVEVSDVVALTSAQCREVAAYLTALADARDPQETPMPETTTHAEPLARTLLAVPAGHGAPHHDAGRIKPGDYVVQVDRDGEVRADIAHYQDKKGDWFMEDGRVITWVGYRADRPDALTVWPAPTPPAVEVEMPNEFGAVITDVEDWNGETYDRLAFLGLAFEDSVDKVHPDELTAFTLPDGTRVRRDGERPDGEPRFVKEARA